MQTPTPRFPDNGGLAFLKYVGRKTTVAPFVVELYRRVCEATGRPYVPYLEPFCGSGEVGLQIRNRWTLEVTHAPAVDFTLNDVNLMTYGALVQARLPKSLQEVADDMEMWPDKWNAESYYVVREAVNLSLAKKDVPFLDQIIYLNRAGHRGVMRMNKQGLFNVPWGHYKKPPSPKAMTALRTQIANAHEILKDMRVTHLDFRDSMAGYYGVADTFMYCDPPYLGSETNYTGNPWVQEDLEVLCGRAQTVAYPVISHSDHEVLRDMFPESGWIFHYVAEPAYVGKGKRPKMPDDRLDVLIYPATLGSLV